MSFEVNQKVKCIRPNCTFSYYDIFVRLQLPIIMGEKWFRGSIMTKGEHGIIIYHAKHPTTVGTIQDRNEIIYVVQTAGGMIFLMEERGIVAL